MTYQAIIDRICNNLEIASPDAKLKSILKLDLFDEATNAVRIARSLTAEATSAITTAATTYALPSTFFMPLQVLFFNSDGLRYKSVEVTREMFLRWLPASEIITTSFNDIITDSTPEAMIVTEENVLLDGKIGYYFSDANPQVLTWKPAIDGSLSLLYVSVPTTAVSDLTSSPSVHTVFHELLVVGGTIRMLRRKLLNAESELKLYAINGLLSNYQKKYDSLLADLAGFVNINAEVTVVQPQGIFDDFTMHIFRGR